MKEKKEINYCRKYNASALIHDLLYKIKILKVYN